MIFGRLGEKKFFCGLSREAFVNEFTDFYCLTNYLHPFREGNGRTQRIFLSQLIDHAEYRLNWADIDGDLLMIATIQSAHGVTDLLHNIFEEAIR